MNTRGFCLCKKTSWRFSGDPSWACYCHCDDCRRNCGAPVVAWLGVPVSAFEWTGDEPKTFESSKGVSRYFCGTCGSPMAFQAEHYEGEIHVYAASLENPEGFKPTFHVFAQRKLPWLGLQDDLTKYDSSLLHSQPPSDG